MYQRGDRWYSDFWYQGRRYKKSWGSISKTVATEKDRKFRVEVAEGKYTVKSKRILFETFSEKYMEYARVNKKPKSVRRNEVSIRALSPYFKAKMLNEIYPFIVEQYKKARKEKGKAPATINRDVTLLKNMFKKAVEWQYLSVNSLWNVPLLKEKNERMWVLTPEEEQKLMEACARSPQRGKKRYLEDLVQFALHSGMREQEIFNVRKIDIHLENLYIEVADSKNNESRNVPVNDTLKEVCERRLQDPSSEYVFSNSKGKKLTVLTNAFWYAVKKAGLTRTELIRNKVVAVRFRFHDLRHTFGSRLGMAGKDLKTIMEVMGHKTERMAMRYQHPMPGHKLEAVKTLDKVPPLFTPQDKEKAKIVSIF